MKRIILPLDDMSLLQASCLYGNFVEKVAYVKVGLELWSQAGPQVFNFIDAYKVMLDLKLHDIPTTMRLAVKRLCVHRSALITMHASAGLEAMRLCVNATKDTKTRIVAVTLLTSQPFDQHRFQRLVIDALEAGVTHFVCSPKAQEVKYIKQMAEDFRVTVITPGISLDGHSRDDQNRVTTPVQALNNGADYIVVGRPITNSKNPSAVIDRINKDITDRDFRGEKQGLKGTLKSTQGAV